MRRKSLLVLFSCLTALAAASGGESSEYGKILMSLMKAPVSPPDRQAAAVFLEKECQRFLDLVPPLSPIQAEWLESEVQRGRHREAINQSPEFNRRVLFKLFDKCAKGALLVQKGSETQKVLGWALILSALDDPSVDIYIQRALVSALDDYTGLWLFAQPILDNIVIPQLAERAGVKMNQ